MQRLNVIPILAVLSAGMWLCGCKPDSGRQAPTVSSQPTTERRLTTAGATSASTEAPAPASSPVPNRPLIVCFGDSLTAGYGTDPGEAYPDYLQQDLTAAGYSYRVVNSGISGNTTKDGVERLPHIIAQRPALVVLEFGGNDGLRGLPLKQTQQNLATMLDQLTQAHINVALAGITLPPDYGPDYIAKFNAMYPQLARRFHVPFLPFLLQGAYGVPGSMQEDHTHATAQGNQQVALNVQKLIQPLLHR